MQFRHFIDFIQTKLDGDKTTIYPDTPLIKIGNYGRFGPFLVHVPKDGFEISCRDLPTENVLLNGFELYKTPNPASINVARYLFAVTNDSLKLTEANNTSGYFIRRTSKIVNHRFSSSSSRKRLALAGTNLYDLLGRKIKMGRMYSIHSPGKVYVTNEHKLQFQR
jgi:hypothetical protein